MLSNLSQRKAVKRAAALIVTTILFTAGSASAAQIYWTDWLGSDLDPGVGFQGQGVITTPTATVNVTYTNPRGVGFYQSSPGTDWWVPRVPVSSSPYTSAQVDNPPTFTDIVALQYAGNQTLQFSETIANPVFSYVSLNGNGYAFLNQDFDILSFGHTSDGNSSGYWGPGTSFKNIVDLGGGNIEYQLLGTGEPHGTIQFKGAFDSVSWRSLSNEYWNGFTVGVQGTADEVLGPAAVPEPSTLLLLATGLSGVALAASRRKK